VVADHLVRPLEGHNQRFRAFARRDVKAVEREVVGVDTDMRVLEGAKPVEAALARQQAVDSDSGVGFGAQHQVRIGLRSRQSAVET
jgi:hypothetical protein